ncbi:MAG: FHA domain-containing protein [Gemmataceae bacterium]|nr:FHA domain-containing protein [Gemmataceae bacterium]
MLRKLIVLAGPDEGRMFPLGDEPLLCGRSRANDIHLIDPHISRVHCQFLVEGGQYVINDFDSAGGTFANGKQIQRHLLQSGDLIHIGNTHLQFIVEAIASPAAIKTSPGTTPISDWSKLLVGQSMSHYKLTAPLARGKTGFLFHARDTRNDTAVAVKVLNPSFGQDEKKVQHFVEAMKQVLPLHHPHLLRVLGAGKTNQQCWVATEYVPGDSLAAVIARIEKPGIVEWKAVLRLGVYLARALEYAHQKQLIHQNVTPQNVLVGKSPQKTKLTDLMLASATEEDPTTPISAAGVPSESLPYQSPERTDGHGAVVDARTDVYSLATTLHAMMVGKLPFQGTSVEELVEKIRLDTPPSLQILGVNVPAELAKVMRAALAKRAKDRPTSADVRAIFERIAQENSVAL